MSSTRASILLLACLIALVSYYLWPALGLTHFFAYADNAIHGLPLAKLHHDILHHGESALWTPLIYGGHPIFAESQGAFTNPLNIVLNLLFEPVTVSTLLHWLGMAMSATGMFALCRVLDLSPTASAFAAVAAVFSPFWLNINNNAVVMAAVGWVPWTLWAFETWLRRPTLATALRFGAFTAMLILPGYPHLLHGAVIYMATSLLPTLISDIRQAQWRTRLRLLGSSGALAVIVTSGLVAVQLLPLLELINESHRSQGVRLPWFVFPILYERGMLFASSDAAAPSLLYPLISSTMVCMLAAAAVFLAPRHRIIGIALATFLLGHLGMAHASQVFTFVHTHNLIPGLNRFRIMHPYFLPALIGIGVLAGAAIDGLARRWQASATPSTLARLATAVGAVMAALVLAYAIKVHVAPISRLFLLTGAATLLLPLLFRVTRRMAWLAPALALLLLTEVVATKLVKPNYQPVSLIETPDIVTQIPQAQRRDYKFIDLADTAGALGLGSTSPAIPAWFQRVQAAVGPSTNLLWDVPSIGGAFALNLTRHTLPEVHLRQEAAGDIRRPPGLRMIDLLGLRYITAPQPLPTEGLTLLTHDRERNLYFYRNDFAQPRFQAYDAAVAASDLPAAFDTLRHIERRVLVVETDSDTLRKLVGNATTTNDRDTATPALAFTVRKSASDHYAFEVDAAHGGWLFIADNMYPGWHALLDGKPTPLFAAQVMGKAVWVPAGKHQVDVMFTSRSYHIGLAITLVTLGIVVYLAAVSWQRRYLMQRQARPIR